MKWNLFERGITCLLLSAATIAVASGVKLADPPEDDEIAMVAEEGTEDEIAESVAETLADELVEVGSEAGGDEERLSALVEEVQNANDEEKPAKREALKNALTEVFRKRTEAQRTRIAMMREKLEAIEVQLDRRSTAEEQIVQRRISELLGDKDELSWDHEPEMNLSKGKRAMQERVMEEIVLPDFPSNFPMEYPYEIAKARGMELREQASAGVAYERKRADVERAAREVAIVKANAERARAAFARSQATNQASLGELDLRLKGLNRLNGNGNQSQGNREQKVEQLRQQLESMRSQSKALEKQLQEISKPK